MSEKTIQVLSLGAGVQSSTLALMAAKGEVTPMPEAAIFADTGNEPAEVLDNLERLKKLLPFPVYTVKKKGGTLAEQVLKVKLSKHGNLYLPYQLPWYYSNKQEQTVVGMRTCTNHFKIQPVSKKIKQLLKEHDAQKCILWIGISWDEIQRVKDSRDNKIVHRYPLVDKRLTRASCIEWNHKHELPVPPRSACTFCPFHNHEEFVKMKRDDPDTFKEATDFDDQLGEASRKTALGEVFVHRSLTRLKDVDLRSDEDKGQLDFFQNECAGFCGT